MPKNKKGRVFMGKDMISNLPDDVLGKIMSLVPTKLAASISLLSKRWMNLLPLLDSFDFDESLVFHPHENLLESQRHRFSDFVDKTLLASPQLLGCSSSINKFSLKCVNEFDESRINSWIRSALERGCVELNLDSSDHLAIDSEFFTSDTLVKLTISEFFPQGRLPLDGIFFPALKSLSLSSVAFQSLEMHKLFIHGCPALEELLISVWMGYLSSPNVKRLTITSDLDDDWHHRGLTIHTPSLVYLDYSSYVADHYNLAFDSLVEARLDLWLYESNIYDDDGPLSNEICGNVTSLIEGIRNIKSLHLSPHSLEAFFFCCHSMPVLDNLVSLSIESDEEKGWQVMPRLLRNSPNLQTLVIKGLAHRVTDWCGDACACKKNSETVCCLSTCGVKELEVSGYRGSLRELKHMRHFLGKLKCLETVKIGVQGDCNNLRASLMALPTVSSKSKIHFI